MWLVVVALIIILIVLLIVFRRNQKVHIACMMKKPKNIDQWLDHHRKLGIDSFHIRLEDTPELEGYLRSQPDVSLEIGESSGNNEYTEKQTRQKEFVDRALEQSNGDWLIHIDSDELVDGNLGSLKNVDPKTRTLVMNNKEAVFKDVPKKEDSCFEAARFRDCSVESCAAYGNGKGIGRVAPDVNSNGSHRFKSSGKEETINDLHVLHFESCDFELYKDKFKGLAKNNTSDIPFDYYKESIDAAQNGTDTDLEKIFRKYRT